MKHTYYLEYWDAANRPDLGMVLHGPFDDPPSRRMIRDVFGRGAYVANEWLPRKPRKAPGSRYPSQARGVWASKPMHNRIPNRLGRIVREVRGA